MSETFAVPPPNSRKDTCCEVWLARSDYVERCEVSRWLIPLSQEPKRRLVTSKGNFVERSVCRGRVTLNDMRDATYQFVNIPEPRQHTRPSSNASNSVLPQPAYGDVGHVEDVSKLPI